MVYIQQQIHLSTLSRDLFLRFFFSPSMELIPEEIQAKAVDLDSSWSADVRRQLSITFK